MKKSFAAALLPLLAGCAMTTGHAVSTPADSWSIGLHAVDGPFDFDVLSVDWSHQTGVPGRPGAANVHLKITDTANTPAVFHAADQKVETATGIIGADTQVAQWTSADMITLRPGQATITRLSFDSPTITAIELNDDPSTPDVVVAVAR